MTNEEIDLQNKFEDPAGYTYEVEDIDGPHAARARAALARWGLEK